MSKTINQRSKELAKYGIITADNIEWKHPEIDLVYTRRHLIEDTDEGFSETINNFCNRINSKRLRVNDIEVNV